MNKHTIFYKKLILQKKNLNEKNYSDINMITTVNEIQKIDNFFFFNKINLKKQKKPRKFTLIHLCLIFFFNFHVNHIFMSSKKSFLNLKKTFFVNNFIDYKLNNEVKGFFLKKNCFLV